MNPTPPYRGRFAPSPTGDLHFGSLVAALGSWLRARRHGGRWLVRVDDIDRPREIAGSTRSILAALQRLGMQPDEPPLYQSDRSGAYTDALQRLRGAGHAFPCWCSRTALEAAGVLHRDGHCIVPPRDDRPPAWRLRVANGEIRFSDNLQGTQRQDVRVAAGDFVLKRADGPWGYQLASVVDDAFQGITEVVRGCDLLDSTPRQILLQRLLGLSTPEYLHLPLAVDPDGRKLSKASGAVRVDTRDPLEVLARALRFLGQPVPATRDVESLLRVAARDFDPAAMRGPMTRTVPQADAAHVGTQACERSRRTPAHPRLPRRGRGA